MSSTENRTPPSRRPRPCGPARTPRTTTLVWIVAAVALALGTAPLAGAADFVPVDLALTLICDVSDGTETGSATLAFLDGDVALDTVNDGTFRLFALLRSRGLEAGLTVHLYAPDGDGWSLDLTESATLDELMGDAARYKDFADLLLLMLSPASPLHPCVRTVPDDRVLEGDFSV